MCFSRHDREVANNKDKDRDGGGGAEKEAGGAEEEEERGRRGWKEGWPCIRIVAIMYKWSNEDLETNDSDGFRLSFDSTVRVSGGDQATERRGDGSGSGSGRGSAESVTGRNCIEKNKNNGDEEEAAGGEVEEEEELLLLRKCGT